MEPTEALRRLAYWCGQGTGIKGYYPVPSATPRLPAAVVLWTGGRVTTLGSKQQWIVTGKILVFVADLNEAEKVAAQSDALIPKIIDRFRQTRDNPARSLFLEGEEGMVDHCHVGRGGDDPLPFLTSEGITGWKAQFYGSVFPFEIKLTRDPEAIV